MTEFREPTTELDNRDLVGSHEQRDGWCDVFARYRDGVGWYVKLTEHVNGLIVISHHPLEFGDVTTVDGRVISPAEPPEEPTET